VVEKNIFIFDKNSCVGCHACVVACVNENGMQFPEPWRNVLNSNPGNHPDLPLFYLSMACNHCDEAPCLNNCPTNAFRHDPETGAIVHEEKDCIGCTFCSWVCPYDAPKFIPSKGVIEKCTFCTHRLEEGLKPSCASLCPVGALDFAKEPFSFEDSFASSPVPVSIGSSLKVIELRRPEGPEMDLGLFPEADPGDSKPKWKKEISAKKEWPLVSFTLICAFLVGFFSPGNNLLNKDKLEPFVLLAGFVAAGLSLIHIGKKTRAWKSVLNIKNSWLSREILFFLFFLMSAFLQVVVFEVPKTVFFVNGILLIISIDFLYLPVQWKWKLKIHSGQVFFISLSLWAFLSGNISLFLSISFIRVLFLLFRKSVNGLKEEKGILTTGLKLILIFLSSVLIYSGKNEIAALAFLVLFDILERIDFYNELKPARPEL
jgi:Fe-S-cluster-containing dehydrogenase component